MELSNWDGSPNGKIHSYDVIVAKNYLSGDELRKLERIVSAYLDFAEEMAERHIPMTMEDWEERLNSISYSGIRMFLRIMGRYLQSLQRLMP